jgi:hypothetical protein
LAKISQRGAGKRSPPSIERMPSTRRSKLIMMTGD